MMWLVCSAEAARAEELTARQQADQRAQQAASQHAEEMQTTRAALAALKKSLDLKDQGHQAAAIDFQAQVVKVLKANARASDAEQARLSAVSCVDQHSLYAKQANDRANNFEQQLQQAQHAAQQAQHDAQQKASRVRELEVVMELVRAVCLASSACIRPQAVTCWASHIFCFTCLRVDCRCSQQCDAVSFSAQPGLCFLMTLA